MRDAVLRDAALHLIIGAVVLTALRAPGIAWAAFGALVCAAALSPWLARRATPAMIPSASSGAPGLLLSRIKEHGIGRLWRWQRSEAGVALRGRSIALGGFAWLLVPMSGGWLTIVAVGVAGLLVASLASGWSRSVAVLPRAQAWLAPQPQRPAQFLRATAPVPFAILALAMALTGAATSALGVPAFALWMLAAVAGLATLHFAVVAAQRRTPRRIAPLFVLHCVLLLAVLQAFAPLAPLCWMLQMILLLRKALR